MKSLKHLNKYFYKYRWRLILGVFFVAIANFFKVYATPFVRKAIDYAKGAATHQNITTSEAGIHLLYFALIILGMALAGGLFTFLMRQSIIVMSRLIEYDLKNEIYEHYQKLDMGFYKRNNTGDLMNRISEDVSRVRMYIGPAIMYIVNTIIIFTMTINVMVSVNLKLTLYVLTPLPILSVTIYYVSNIINKKSTLVQQQLSRLSTLTQEAFSGIRVLKAYRREKAFLDDFEKESIVYKDKNLDLVKTDALFQPFMILLIGLSTLFTIYIGGLEAIHGKISLGNIAEFIIYVNNLTWPVASLGWVTSLIQRAAASQTRINEFLQTEPAIQNPTSEELNVKGDIEFKNVSFIYPDSGIKALDNVSFQIKAGQSLAIIGRTGAGKSTIANLVCRMYDVNKGEVLIDEQNITSVNIHALREQIGYVPQEVFLFSETIANNIAFSSKDIQNMPNKEKVVEQAAKDAAIYSNIIEFPKKFETRVGERGITLSGGQKQRISIARALLKSPQILIFDDCLSAVDTETETEILNNLSRIMQGKTSIIISHRVSSVKNADEIIVLDNGTIAEQGTHNQLIKQKGIYFELYQMQLLEEEEHKTKD